jgi:hypothetical protein
VSPDRARAVEAAVEDDPDHRVPAIRQQLLRARDEVTGSVVDEDIDLAEVTRDAHHHLVHLLGIANVELNRERIEPGVTEIRRPLFQMLGVATRNGDAGAELAQAFCYREPDPGSTTGDDRDLTFEQRGDEHAGTDYPRPG